MFNKFMRGIRTIRTFKGMTKKDIADRAGIPQTTYFRYESSNGASNPTLNTIVKISNAVGMTIEDVLDFVDRVEAELDKRTLI